MVNVSESAAASIFEGERPRSFREHPANPVDRDDVSGPLNRELIDQHKEPPPSWEMGLGLLMAAVWVVLFASGAFVPTQTYREELLAGKGYHLGHFAVVLICYTLTNILFLAVLASGIGCVTCRWKVTSQVEQLMPFYTSIPAKRAYFAAALRGFFLYLAIISGFLVMATEDAVLNTGFSQYIRVAGITSIFGFIVGYDPQVIYRLMGKVNDLANKPLQGTGAAGNG